MFWGFYGFLRYLYDLQDVIQVPQDVPEVLQRVIQFPQEVLKGSIVFRGGFRSKAVLQDLEIVTQVL